MSNPRFWTEEKRTIMLFTVAELLDGNFAHKLAGNRSAQRMKLARMRALA